MKLSGWGRYPAVETTLHAPRDLAELQRLVQTDASVIARGNGRAYGDSAVNPPATVHMRHFNHLQSFEPGTGRLVAESGVLLGDIIQAFLPMGWFPGVTPGTKFVTLGGMIAADVHGKNHHKEGSFASFVDWIDVLDGSGNVQRCSATENGELFRWTLGGMGLTGIVLRAGIRLRPVESGWIRQETIATANLREAMDAFDTAQGCTYSVAWIDCLSTGDHLGRSLLMLGEHASASEAATKSADRYAMKRKRKLAVPLDFPSFALNRYSVKAFNQLYYWKGARKYGPELVDWDSYFYPLDAILNWNRIYGRKGFAQFQCALPLDASEAGLTALLSAIAGAGAGSFLAVLKRLGPQDSAFSFPMDGYTLALDFPVNRKTLKLMDELDRITVDHGGRFYLAKDSRMTAKTLRQADHRADVYRQKREDEGWSGSFRSSQSERLSI